MIRSAQRELAGWVASRGHSAVPEAARNIGRQSLLDTLAVAFAGRQEDVVTRTGVYARAMRDGAGTEAWTTGNKYKPEAAALLNAVSAHALDYDDITPAWRGHPGAVIWPALFAVSHGHEVSYEEVLDTFALGFEVGAQVGTCLSAHHYGSGWHSTATMGLISASAGCARILGFDADQIFHAIGLAVSQCAGVQGQFGSMAKPLQAGFAASAAVRAVQLAGAGVESGDVLEGNAGFSKLYGGVDRLRIELPSVTSTDLAITRCGVEVKQFPNCYAGHRAVQAALELRASVGSDKLDIRAIRIEGTPGAHQPLLERAPSTVDESRFSVEYGVACALLDGKVQLSSFSDLGLQRPDVRNLIGLTTVSENEALGVRRAARVSMTLANGHAVERTVTQLPGTFGDAAFMRRLGDKVDDCMSHAGLANHAGALVDAALSLSGASSAAFARWPVFTRIWGSSKSDDTNSHER